MKCYPASTIFFLRMLRICCLLLMGVSGVVKGQVLSDNQSAIGINLANGPQRVSVKIYGGAEICNNGTLTISIPSGYGYVASSARVTPYNNSDVAIGTAVPITTESIAVSGATLTIPSIPVGGYVLVEYDVVSSCGAETNNISYSLNACSPTPSTAQGPLNIRKASLNMVVSPVTYTALAIEESYTRTIQVRNDGIGTIDTIYVDRSVASGFTYDTPTYSASAGVTIISGTFIPAQNRYRIITNGLPLGSSVTISEPVTVKSNVAANLIANYDAWYGVNGAKCAGQNGTGVGSAIVETSAPVTTPGLSLVTTAWPILKCAGAAEYHTIRVTNTNTTMPATIQNLRGYFNGLTMANANSFLGYRSFYIGENSGQYSTDNGTTWLDMAGTVVERYASSPLAHNGGQPTIVDFSPTSTLIIPASGTILFRYSVHYNPYVGATCPSNNAFYWNWPRVRAFYEIDGTNRNADYSNNNAVNYWQFTGGTNLSRTDVHGGEDYYVNIRFNGRIFTQAQYNDNTGYVKLVFHLPAGFTPSSTVTDHSISDGTNTLVPDNMVITPDGAGGYEVELLFNNPATANRFGHATNGTTKIWTTNLKTSFVCAGTTVNYNITMDALAKKSDCGPELKFMCGVNVNVESHACAPCNIDAATTTGSYMERTTLGTSTGGPLSLQHFVQSDRGKLIVTGAVETITAGKAFDYLFVRYTHTGSTTAAQYSIEADSTATAVVTRGGVNYTITNIPLSGPAVTGDFRTARLHEGTMPTGFDGKFRGGDVIKMSIPFRYEANLNNAYIEFKSTFYAAETATPANESEKLYCDHGYTARGFSVQLTQSITNNANAAFSTCAHLTNGVRQGRFLVNLMLNGLANNQVFENEIREFFTVSDHFELKVPTYITIPEIRVHLEFQGITQSITATAGGVLFTPVGEPVADGAGNHTYIFDLTSILQRYGLSTTQVNQSARLSVWPHYVVTCYDRNYSGTNSQWGYKYTGMHTLTNTQTLATTGHQVNSTENLFVPVNISTPTPIQNISGNTATWDIHLSYPYSGSKNNVWIAPLSTAGFNSVKVFEISSIGATTVDTEITVDANGFFQLGNAAAYENKYYRIEGVLADCNAEQKLDLIYDFGCGAYPTSLDAVKEGCRVKHVELTAIPTPAALQVEIMEQPTSPHEICNNLEYTFRLNNSSLAEVRKLGLHLELGGVLYTTGSLQVAQVSGLTVPATADYSAPTTGTVTPVSGGFDIGIPEYEIGVGEFIWVKVAFTPDGCNFTSGQRLLVQVLAEDVCQNIVFGDNDMYSDRVNVLGMPTQLPTVALSSTATAVHMLANGGLSLDEYSVTVENIGALDIGAAEGYFFTVQLPTGWTLDPAAVAYEAGSGYYGASYDSHNAATNTYRFLFDSTSGLPVAGKVKLTTGLSLTPSAAAALNCGAEFTIREAVYAHFAPEGSCVTGCEIEHMLADHAVTKLIIPVPPIPSGQAQQTFCDAAMAAEKPTLADVVAQDLRFARWYSGATAAVADSIPSSTVLANGQTYYVRNALAQGGVCQSAALAITITLNPYTSINVQPVGTTHYAGQSTILSVEATGTNLTYQWYKKTNAADADGEAIVGATAATYTTPTTLTSGAHHYYVVVTGTCGIVRSDVAVLDVRNTTYAIDDINTTFVGTPVSGNVLTNDFDLEGDVQSINSTPVVDPAHGMVTINADGSYTYTPNAGFVGEDTFVYEVCDNGTPMACDRATVTITVIPVGDPTADNNAVYANNDAVVTDQGTAVRIPVLVNDLDPDGDDFSITPGSVTMPANGQVVLNTDGTITYTPNPDFVGDDIFEYQICDVGTPQACDKATVTVTVLPTGMKENYTHAVDDVYYGTGIGAPISGNVLDNDYDNEDDDQSISSYTQPAHGAVTVNPNGTFDYVPNSGYAGPDQFVYTVCDNGTPVACDKATVYIVVNPVSSIELLKDGTFNDTNADGYAQVGETITYVFTVKNTGNVPVHELTINDSRIGVTNLAVIPGTLAPGGTGTATASYILKQDDITDGGVWNIATATGKDPSGGTVSDTSTDPTPLDPTDPNIDPSCPACTVTLLPLLPELTLVKTAGSIVDANGDGRHSVGDQITYTFVLTNTGDAVINALSITDNKLGLLNQAFPVETLAPGESTTYTQVVPYVLTQEDIDAGEVVNTATAQGKDPEGKDVSDVSDTGTDRDGAIINTPEAVDSNSDGNPSNDPTVLDLDRLPSLTFTKTDALTTDVDNNGEISLNDILTYTFVVRNTGNVTLRNVLITDTDLPGIGVLNYVWPVPATPGVLLPGQILTATASYTVRQADVDGGKVENQATVSVDTPPGAPDVPDTKSDDPDTTEPNDPTVVDVPQHPELTLVKTAGAIADTNGDGRHSAGDEIRYTFSLTNTGNVTISNPTFTDNKLNLIGVAFAVPSLAPGASVTYTQVAPYRLTQADINAGEVSNTATAQGKDPRGNDVSDVSDTGTSRDGSTISNPENVDSNADGDPSNDPTVLDLQHAPAIALVKTSAVLINDNEYPYVRPADKVKYTFVITNTGNVTLRTIELKEDMFSGTGTLAEPQRVSASTGSSETALLPNGTLTYEVTYDLTQADINKGRLENRAIVTGRSPKDVVVQDVSGTLLTNDNPTVTILPRNPSVVIDKVGDTREVSQVGDVITYTLKVTNNGNVTLTNVVVTDPLTSFTSTATVLAPGETVTYTTTYKLTTADFVGLGSARKQLVNVARVDASYEGGGVNDEDDWSVDVFAKPIRIPNIFTPNGDGKNDTFVIEGYEAYDRMELTIFNRWGNEVYRNDNYKNEWDGRHLNTGTYFYLLHMRRGSEVDTYKGYVMVKPH